MINNSRKKVNQLYSVISKGGTDGKDLSVCACVCGSAHDCGCVIDGSNAMVAL